MDSPMTVRHEKMRIAGKLVDGDTGKNIEVLNPYNGEVVGTVPRASREQIAAAFDIAANYKPTLTRYERQKILMRIAELIVERKDEISDMITAECGLSKKDSIYEVGRAFDVYSLSGQQCINDDSKIFSCDLTPHGKKRKIFTQRDPLLGAISAITPFNHPLNMISHKIAPSIATNNCMVAKPTEQTPLTALILADICYEAGLPPEMLSVVTGLPKDMGDEMLTNKHIDLISFTGSVPVGKYIAETAGYRRTILELGGNAPLIVMDDADLDKAAELGVAVS
jgi:acyl-CoA reductase-like NAD-dependent aldehyde dehydrogenase